MEQPVGRRALRYLAATFQARRTRRGDPRVRLQQAISAAQEQHRRLREHAAGVIANEKHVELRVRRARGELRELEASVRDTLRRAAHAERAGRRDRADELNHTAETLADRLVAAEHELSDLRERHTRAAEASQQARAAVRESGAVLQRVLSEREQLLGRLDEAALLAQLERAREMPALDDVRVEVDERYAEAAAAAEIGAQTFDRRMLDVEDELRGVEARRRLDRIRSDLGLSAPRPRALPGEGGAARPS
jgi:phage shock protein A